MPEITIPMLSSTSKPAIGQVLERAKSLVETGRHSKKEIIPVCVAAHEEPSIDAVISLMLKQRFREGFEQRLILCTNGADDTTRQKAKRISESDSRVEWIDTDEQGKARAINLMDNLAYGRFDFKVMIRADADVLIPDPNSFQKIYDYLDQNKGKKGVRVVYKPFLVKPETLEERFVERICAVKEKVREMVPMLYGRLYGIRANIPNLRPIPEGLLNDDKFIATKIALDHGIESLGILEDVVVFYKEPRTMMELIKRANRIKRGNMQMRYELGTDPHYFGNEVNRNMIFQLSMTELAYLSMAFALKKIGDTSAILTNDRSNICRSWDCVRSAKLTYLDFETSLPVS